jgi:hypothetical protein
LTTSGGITTIGVGAGYTGKITGSSTVGGITTIVGSFVGVSFTTTSAGLTIY